MTHIVILCQLFYPELVSTGQTVTELAEALTEQGVEVDVVAGPPTILRDASSVPRDLMYNGIAIHRVWGTRFPKLSMVGKLINHITYTGSVLGHLLFRRIDSPVLVFTNPPFLAGAVALISLVKPITMYYVIFDVYPETGIEAGVVSRTGLIVTLWRWFNQLCYRRADKIVVIGRCMEAVIGKQLLPRDRQKLRRMHVWADDVGIETIRGPNWREKWNLGSKLTFGYSGNLGRFHDFDTLLQAAVALDPECAEFVFVGEGYSKNATMDLARSLKLTQVQFHTYVARDELGSVLTTFDVGLVSLKLGQEGLSVPSKTFGLLAAGIPVLAVMSKQSEIARVIDEVGCGWVVEPGDVEGLVSVYQMILQLNRDALKAIGSRGKIACRNSYSVGRAAQIIRELADD